MKALRILAVAGAILFGTSALADPPPGSGWYQIDQGFSSQQAPGDPCSTWHITTYTWRHEATQQTTTTRDVYTIYNEEACGPIQA